MSRAVDDLAAYLQTLGYGTVGTTIIKDHLPVTPIVGTFLISGGGPPSETGFSVNGLMWEHPRIQVLCRGLANDYATPSAQIQLVYLALPKIQAQTLGSSKYFMVRAIHPPFKLEKDSNNSIIMSCSFLVDKTV